MNIDHVESGENIENQARRPVKQVYEDMGVGHTDPTERGERFENQGRKQDPLQPESQHSKDFNDHSGHQKGVVEGAARTVEKVQHHRDTIDRDKRREREMANQMNQMAGKLAEIQERNKYLEDREKGEEKEKQGMINQIHQMTEKLENVQRHNESLEDVCRHQSEGLRVTSNQLRAAETQHRQTRQLLEAKASELKGAQTFLTIEDSLSGADVIAMLQALNAEILQISAFMADSLDSMDRNIRGEMVSEEARTARDRVTHLIGEPLVHAVTTKFVREAIDPDPLPLQIAIQVVLVHSCAFVIESWIFGFPEYENMLQVIYSQLQKEEEHSVSARWRAITRSQIKRIVDVKPYVLNLISEEIENVLVVVGWSRRQLQQQNFLGRFQERLTIIVNLLLRLQAAVGEDVTSGDLKPQVILANEVFDPRTMDDGLPQDRDDPTTEIRGRVAGTTDIGLQRFLKGSSSLVLSKPKVVLCSALQ